MGGACAWSLFCYSVLSVFLVLRFAIISLMRREGERERERERERKGEREGYLRMAIIID